MDCAASEFYNKEEGIYDLKGEGKKFTSEEFNHFLAELVDEHTAQSLARLPHLLCGR